MKKHIEYDKIEAIYSSNYKSWWNLMNLAIDKENEMDNKLKEDFFNALTQEQQGLYRLINSEITDWVEHKGEIEELTENIITILIINNYKQGKR